MLPKLEPDLWDLPTLQRVVSSPVADGILSKLGRRNPFNHPLNPNDVLWLFDSIAFRHPERDDAWHADFAFAVFKRQPRSRLKYTVGAISRLLGFADDPDALNTIEERLSSFIWDVRPSKRLKLVHQGVELKLGPTGSNGIGEDVVPVQGHSSGTVVTTTPVLPAKGVGGILKMKTFFAEPEGWAVISDIDDTIKDTRTGDPISMLRKTFVDEPAPVPGMPELYEHMARVIPAWEPWFYLSASPYNLYPMLKQFCKQWYPPGTLILRDSNWRTVAGLLATLTTGTHEYKTGRMRELRERLPKRKMILIGDSTQADPEAYAEIYREFPDWVKLILIRRAINIDAADVEANNDDARFEEAFEGVPRQVWHVFDDPAECHTIVEKTVKRG